MNRHLRTGQRPVSRGNPPRLRHQEALLRNELRRLARSQELPGPRVDGVPALLMENASRVQGPLFQR
jgi:hypothetical protein